MSPRRRQQATVVPILGMHRSGTSMVTRALQLLGVALGEPLMKPQEDNPKGFWENEFFYGVNVRILHVLGQHVSGYGRAGILLHVPALSARVERSEANLQAVEAYVHEWFSKAPVWGWKDPRTVLLLPFWLPVLVELGFRRIQPVVIARHPSAVVRSLARRTDLAALAPTLGCTVDQLALEMWTAYSHILLDVVDSTQCLVSLHDWYLEESSARAELDRCAADLGLSPDADAMSRALAWLDPGAVHHREPEPLHGPGADEAMVLWEDLAARARAQRAAARVAAAA